MDSKSSNYKENIKKMIDSTIFKMEKPEEVAKLREMPSSRT